MKPYYRTDDLPYNIGNYLGTKCYIEIKGFDRVEKCVLGYMARAEAKILNVHTLGELIEKEIKYWEIRYWVKRPSRKDREKARWLTRIEYIEHCGTDVKELEEKLKQHPNWYREWREKENIGG